MSTPDEGSLNDELYSATAKDSITSNMTLLPDNFEPGADDVICGRGKKCYNHIGNERFRQRVLTFLDEYSLAKSKLDKSGVLSKVVDEVRQHSPNGGFVKQDANGKWHEVGDFLAREKTSQAFRDTLHDRYKSSNLSKKKRRQEEHAKVSSNSFGSAAMSEYEISRLEMLSNELLGSGTFFLACDKINALFGWLVFSFLFVFLLTLLSQKAEGMNSLDSLNRSNYEILARINQLSSTRFQGLSRRYTPRSSLASESHFPDPLFGSTMNSANEMPSEFEREKLAPQHHMYQERSSHSLASSPPDFARPIHTTSSDLRAFHRSLPELSFIGQEKDPFDQDYSYSIHQSLPELPMPKRARDLRDERRIPRDIDPIPFHHILIPERGSLKSTSEEAPMKKSHQGPAVDESQMSSSYIGRSGHVQISKDLLECLDKMTYHSIADDNPFEPIPLAPQQEKAHAAKKRIADADTTSNLFSNPIVDDSERDEFAEG